MLSRFLGMRLRSGSSEEREGRSGLWLEVEAAERWRFGEQGRSEQRMGALSSLFEKFRVQGWEKSWIEVRGLRDGRKGNGERQCKRSFLWRKLEVAKGF